MTQLYAGYKKLTSNIMIQAGSKRKNRKGYTMQKLIFFLIIIYLFIFGCVGSSLLRAGFLQLWRAGATHPCGARASHCGGFSCCGARVLGKRAQQLGHAGSRAQAQQLQRTDFVAPRHVGSSRTRDRTLVPCMGRQILNHCATREVLMWTFLKSLLNLLQYCFCSTFWFFFFFFFLRIFFLIN